MTAVNGVNRIAALAFGAVALINSVAVAVEPAAYAWSDATVVDTRDAAERFAKPNALARYAAHYVDAAAGDEAYVVVSKVVDADTDYAVTSVVSRCAAGAEGDLAIAPQGAESRRFRLLHAAYAADGTALGDTLAADVVVAYPGTASLDQTVVDTRTNSFQLVAEAGGSAPLAYATEWMTNGTAARVEITQVLDRYSKGILVTSATGMLMSAAAPAAGDFAHRIVTGGGTVTLRCSFFDLGGNLLDEPLSSTYRFEEKWGLCIKFR